MDYFPDIDLGFEKISKGGVVPYEFTKKIPRTPRPEIYFTPSSTSLYKTATCGLRLKKAFPAEDLIVFLRIIANSKLEGPFTDIIYDIKQQNVRRHLLTLVQTREQEIGGKLLTKNLIWAFESLMGSGSPPYDLVNAMLINLLDWVPFQKFKKPLSPPPKVDPKLWEATYRPEAKYVGDLKASGGHRIFFEFASKKKFYDNATGEEFLVKYRGHTNKLNESRPAHLYEVGLSSNKTREAYELCEEFAARIADDPCVKEVHFMYPDEHDILPSKFPRVIIVPTANTPLQQFTESLHLVLEEEEFSEILDVDTCYEQLHKWTSIGIVKNYISRSSFEPSEEACVFSIGCPEGSWGPNRAFQWDAHPFAKEWKVKKDRKHLQELLVARWDPHEDSFVVDYGFFETQGDKVILHPLASWHVFTDDVPPGPKRLGILMTREDVLNWDVKRTKKYNDYVDVLARYGMLENGLLDVSYV